MHKIIFATGNEGKAKEVKQLFEMTNFEIISLNDLEDNTEIIEDANTFEDNAKKKAKTIYDVYKLPVVADDSGLVVEQLNGKPGVHSARYAGEKCTYEDNNNKLLNELKNFSQPHKAKFHCTAVYYDGVEFMITEGKCEGEIIKTGRGNKGFGYDPIFLPVGYDKTLAELDINEKNKLSHRAEAFNKLKKKLIEKY